MGSSPGTNRKFTLENRPILSQTKKIIWLVVPIVFYVHPYLGKIPILTNIFQVGWDHQLEKIIFQTH